MSDFCADIDCLFTDLDFLERFKAVKENGFSFAEFTMPEKIDLGKLGDACAFDGLKIAVLSASKNNVLSALNKKKRGEFEEYFERLIDVADFIGAPFIHIPPFEIKDENERNDIIDAFIGALKTVSPYARQERIKILLSFINPVENPNAFPASTAEVLSLLESLDDDRVFGILYDVYHAQTAEGGLSNTLETLLPLIYHIRIAGAPAHEEPDDGEINYTYLLSLLDAHGYTHAVSASYTPKLNTVSGLRWMKKIRI